ncbi:MAG TPA: Hsp20/alpha crystallin family protein [Rugosimonospora sp.]|jgi:HSP20 family molecular chaperone IbpA
MSTLSLWARRDPFAEFDALVRNAFGPVATWPARRPTGFTPAAEVSRDGEDAVVRVELPGLDVTNDVTVEVDRGRLVVRGERRDERTQEQDGRSLREVRYGSFQRSFDLPAHVSADAVSASYDAGVLSVRVAGAYAGTGARRIAIAGTGTGTPAVEPGTPAVENEAENTAS